MEEFRFPFPGRELADRELTYDPCYSKVPAEDRAAIVEKAWQKGCAAAREVFRRENGSGDFRAIVTGSGLQLNEKDTDFVAGSQRYFSDYISGQKCVNLYKKSIALWAGENGLDYEQAVDLILSHEYFHFLEVTELGLTSRDYTVAMVQIGPVKLGSTGLRSLSEIGAHAFARTYHDLLRQKEAQEDGTEV